VWGVRTLGLIVVLGLVLTGCGGAPARHPATARLAATPSVTLVAVGDIACPPGSPVTRKTCRQKATYRAAAALDPTRVMVLGDTQYKTGRYHDFTHAYANTWGKLRRLTWPVVGNHEYETRGARGYYRYFAKRQPGAPGYYRRAINGWQLYVLNSNCSKIDCAAEVAWLDDQMAAHPSACSLIATHHPRFSSGGEHGSSTSVLPFWRIAQAAKVDVALAGHDHDYERFAPKLPGGAVSAGGIRQFVSGAGGKSLYRKGAGVSGSKVFLNMAPGVLRLRLTPTSYAWQFRDIWGNIRDAGTTACH